MIERKIELHITATRNEWGKCPIRIRTVTKGPDGKIRASKTRNIGSYVSATNKTSRLKQEYEDFIDLYNLLRKEKI